MRARSLFFSSIAAASAVSASELPSVASINLCADQLLLSVADPTQILTLSWLAADPEESMLAAEARAYPSNYGSAEEILRYAPDVVIGGRYTSAFTRRLLTDLGFTVLTISPARRIEDIERNLLAIASAIDRKARGREVIDEMHARVERLNETRPGIAVSSIVIRPGGFTVGSGTLADALMQLAGIDNIASRQGLDAWGSLSTESLLRSNPELLIFTGFRADAPSLANDVLSHPALGRLAADTQTASLAATYWACGAPESLRSAELLAAAVRQRQSGAAGGDGQ